MDYQIQGKVALVMGGGGGLGSAIARALHDEGVLVVVADVNLEAARRAAGAITPAGSTVLPLQWDLSDIDSFRDRLEHIHATLGPVDILVNNTGGPRPTTAAGVPLHEWRQYFESMALSVIHLTDLVLPSMRQAGWGRVITSSSSGVLAPIDNLGISNTLRASLLGWSKTLAREVARDGITANVVVPGRIATARITSLDAQKAQRAGQSAAQVSAQSEASIPLGRYGQPAEYANAVAFLASQAASYITGTVLRVDGGLVASSF